MAFFQIVMAFLQRFCDRAVDTWTAIGDRAVPIWQRITNNVRAIIKTASSVVLLALTIIGVVYAKETTELAKWTARKEFIEFCTDNMTSPNSGDCTLATNASLAAPPKLFTRVARSLGRHLASIHGILHLSNPTGPRAVEKVQSRWHISQSTNNTAILIMMAMAIAFVVTMVVWKVRNDNCTQDLQRCTIRGDGAGLGDAGSGGVVSDTEVGGSVVDALTRGSGLGGDGLGGNGLGGDGLGGNGLGGDGLGGDGLGGNGLGGDGLGGDGLGGMAIGGNYAEGSYATGGYAIGGDAIGGRVIGGNYAEGGYATGGDAIAGAFMAADTGRRRVA